MHLIESNLDSNNHCLQQTGGRKMENTEIVGATWANTVITGGLVPFHRNSHQTDMRRKAPLITECAAVAQGLDPKTHCFYWKESGCRECFHLRFDEYCDFI